MIYLVSRSKGIEHRDGIEHLAAMCIQRHHPCGHGEDEGYPLPWHEILQFVASCFIRNSDPHKTTRIFCVYDRFGDTDIDRLHRNEDGNGRFQLFDYGILFAVFLYN